MLGMRHENPDHVDPVLFRRAMGTFATGVAVVTTTGSGKLFGMTLNSLTSVSLEPCLLLFCSTRGSATGQAVVESGAFVINILGSGQEDMCRRFVGRSAARFEGLDLQYTDTGLPLLPGVLGHLICRVFDVHSGGDHDVIIGRVERCFETPGEPLVFHRGSYGTFTAAPEFSIQDQRGLS